MAGIVHNLSASPPNPGMITWSLREQGTFGVTISFAAALTGSSSGITATVTGSLDVDEKFEFDALTDPAGTPTTMTLSISATPVCQVDFPSDYMGRTCRFTSKAGDQYTTTFQNGAVSL